MNALSMPGFTAELSVYKTHTHYRTTGLTACHASGQPSDSRPTRLRPPGGQVCGLPSVEFARLSSTNSAQTNRFYPQTICNGRLVNLMTDRANCGACGNDCGDDDRCVCLHGECACWANCCHGVGFGQSGDFGCPLTPCGSNCVDPENCSTWRCVSLPWDPKNCGSCGHACGAGEVCCNGACANLLTDSQNCGSCGHACIVANGTGACMNGNCVIATCNPPFADCNKVYADGCETNTSTDAMNCGSCGHACAVNQLCCHSACMNTQNLQTDPMNCGSCGHVCNAGAGEVCCAGACANLLSDPKNCGGCGKVCAGGKICLGGSCVCPQGLTDCNGVCTNTNGFDPHNCGGCFKACPGNQSCCLGSCKDLSGDKMNCGKCGNVCPSGCSGDSTSCIAGKCGQLKQIPCYLQDPNKCLSGPIVFNAFTDMEAMTCAQQQQQGWVPICGAQAFQAKTYSFAVYAPDNSGMCTGGVCFTTAYALGVNSGDALICAKQTTGANYDYGALNSSCNIGECK